MNTSTEIVRIPLNKLVRSPHNVRKTGGNGIDQLAASILAHGLLHNLVVTKGQGDKHEVIAGGRRLAALKQLAKDKKIPRTFEVPCCVVASENSTETSLAENFVREDMHPADQFDAFRLMIDQGAGIEEVAARFGVSVTTVRQRLRLAHVSPKLLGLYRAGKITLDQLMALAVTEDHTAQEKVWAAAQGWQRHPDTLRRLLTETMVDASSDPRARFVGIQAYVDAGGQIERDLFQPDHEGYLTDTGKLEELAVAKLEEVANEIRAEGWSWVEIAPFGQHPEVWHFGRISVERVPISPEVQAEIETLEAEQEKLRSEHEECEEYPKEVDERLSAIDERLDALNVRAQVYREEDKKLAGAFVSVGNDGKPSVHRGLVRPADKKKVRGAAVGSDGYNSGDPVDDESSGKSLSAALVEDLTAHRTAALRAALALRPDVALVAITHNLALEVCYDTGGYDVGSALSLNTEKGGCGLECHAKGIEESVPRVKAEELRSHWMTRIPAQPSDLWKWLLGQDQPVVLELLAFCVGQMVYAVRLSHYGAGRPEPAFAASDLLAEALNLDMADWWTATGASYFGRVKKGLILEALKEGTGETNLDELGKLKKTDLVSTAEARLAGKRWLPEILKG